MDRTVPERDPDREIVPTGLQIEGLEKSFGPVAAVRGIDLGVAGGEFFTLLGPSGCGKTTILRTIAGIYRADRGGCCWMGAT
jgi:spermidine/putrescine transport system ATP-binding protein